MSDGNGTKDLIRDDCGAPAGPVKGQADYTEADTSIEQVVDSKDAYAASGVDIAAGDEAVKRIAEVVKATHREGVVDDIGGFGGRFRLFEAIKGMQDPQLVAGTDGVGTKLALAQEYGYHESVGIDLVAMCANDILAMGAEPLFFLDYIATGETDPEKMAKIVSGIAEGCKLANCALIGGEMAEHNTMDPKEYDLAGFCVGVHDSANTYHSVSGERIEAGDVVIGLASSGIHSNGFSLARNVLDYHRIALHDVFSVQNEELSSRIKHIKSMGDSSGYRDWGEVLLQPTTIYVKPVLGLLWRAAQGLDVRGLVHITGGGLGNISRILPDGFGVEITDPLPVHPEFCAIFNLAKEHSDSGIASIDANTMYRTFNMGMGFCVIASQGSGHHVLNKLDELMPECEADIVGYVTDDGQIRHTALGKPFQL